jgi:hypothetical protein
MILFLDFDGVLHPDPSGNREKFCCAPLLWKILRACPHVEVVFSTSWREVHEFDLLVEFVTFGGGEDLANRFIGSIPIHPESKTVALFGERDYTRENECLAWLREHREGTSWLALDDMPHHFRDLDANENLYHVDMRKGLTDVDATAIIGRIQSELADQT